MGPALEKDMRIIYETYKQRYNFHLNPAIEQALFDMVNGNVQYLQLALIILAERKNGGVKTKEELFQTLVHDERITLQSEELWESITKDEKRALAKILKNEKITPEEKKKIDIYGIRALLWSKIKKTCSLVPFSKSIWKAVKKKIIKQAPLFI